MSWEDRPIGKNSGGWGSSQESEAPCQPAWGQVGQRQAKPHSETWQGHRAPELPREHGWDGWVSGACLAGTCFLGPGRNTAAQKLGRFERLYPGLPRQLSGEKHPPANAGDLGSILGLGRSPGGGYGNSLQYSYLENPMDREAWRATVHRITKNRTRLSTHTWASVHRDT